ELSKYKPKKQFVLEMDYCIYSFPSRIANPWDDNIWILDSGASLSYG
ncbi:hypothetical protein TNCV_3313721, partial [Trichonephila clavipes]